MKTSRLMGLLLAPVVLLSNLGGWMPRVSAQNGCLSVLHSSSSEVLLELSAGRYQIERDGSYDRVSLPGTQTMSQPGQPQLPVCGALLGIPDVDDMQVEVIKADFTVEPGLRIAPAPTPQISAPTLDDYISTAPEYDIIRDEAIYSDNAFFPGELVVTGSPGYLRDQAVVQVQLYPVQYNPVSGEARLYSRIQARLTWRSPIRESAENPRASSPAFEQLLKETIINYSDLDRAEPAQAVRTDILSTDQPAQPEESQMLKIGVNKDGMYRLTPGDLTSHGFDLTGVSPDNIRITNQEQEIPILVQEDGNGAFDGSDYILFYGTAISDVYTTKNVYWLSAGSAPGLRMDTRDGTPGVAPTPVSFPVTLHAEQDTFYWQTMPDGLGQDHWFWEDRLSPNTQGLPDHRDYSFTIQNKSTGNNQTLLVRLKGFTSMTALYPDHKTQIAINGYFVGSAEWDGFNVFDINLDYSTSLLQEGSNTLTVTALDAGAAVDQYLVNFFEIDYPDTYIAEQNELAFNAPSAGDHRFVISNFSTNDVQLFDITDAANVIKIENTLVEPAGGAQSLSFEDSAALDMRYLALTPARYKLPASLELDQPSVWKSAGNGADYIIITHQDFYSATLPLATYRSSVQGGGLRVATVKIEDIYDEFNGGIFNPQAIRDFLSYTYNNWQAPAPTYVLLVGGASYDYRDLLNLSRVDYVPTQMIETFLLGQTASDNWFVQINGNDILPEMVIGRFTAKSNADVTEMVNKTIYYEQNPPPTSWNTRGLFIADDDEIAFEQINDSLAGMLPLFYSPQKVYLREYTQGQDPTVDITNAINAGSLVVNYAGHGNPSLWAGSGVFTVADVNALSNMNKLTVVSVGNCLSGFFVGKDGTSMSEAFLGLTGNKGAVAVWAPTGLGYAFGHKALLDEFYAAIFKEDVFALGSAATLAKIRMYAENSGLGELVETYVFFGDPATRIYVVPHEEIYMPFVIDGN